MKIAIEELAGCSGCTISILDFHEVLLDVVAQADILYSSVSWRERDHGNVTSNLRNTTRPGK